MWSGLPRCADPSRLYFSRSLGGLEMPSLPTVIKKLQVTRHTGLLTSRDTCCRFLAKDRVIMTKGTAKNFLAAVEANQIGVYQGDPLSAAIFNVVINLLLHTIQSQCHHLGYHFSSSSVVMPALQYADDTALFPIVKRTVKPCWMLHNAGQIGL